MDNDSNVYEDDQLDIDYEAMEAHDKEIIEKNRPICAICDKPMEGLNYQAIFRPDWLAGKGLNDDLTPSDGCRLGVEIYAVAHCHGKHIRINIDDRYYRLKQPFGEQKAVADLERLALQLEKRDKAAELARAAHLFVVSVVAEND